MSEVLIYTDGGARGNPGPAGAGFVIVDDGKITHKGKKFLGERQTNNWAEYEAVALALEALKKLGHEGRALRFRLDSQLVAEQLSGNWKIKEAALKEQAKKVRALLVVFGPTKFSYVPRAQNAEADALVNEALDEAGH